MTPDLVISWSLAVLAAATVFFIIAFCVFVIIAEYCSFNK